MILVPFGHQEVSFLPKLFIVWRGPWKTPAPFSTSSLSIWGNFGGEQSERRIVAMLKASAQRQLQLQIAVIGCTASSLCRTLAEWIFCSKCTQPPPSAPSPSLSCFTSVTCHAIIEYWHHIGKSRNLVHICWIQIFPHLKIINQQQMMIFRDVRLWFVNPGSLCFCLKFWQLALLWAARVRHCSKTF